MFYQETAGEHDHTLPICPAASYIIFDQFVSFIIHLFKYFLEFLYGTSNPDHRSFTGELFSAVFPSFLWREEIKSSAHSQHWNWTLLTIIVFYPVINTLNIKIIYCHQRLQRELQRCHWLWEVNVIMNIHRISKCLI